MVCASLRTREQAVSVSVYMPAYNVGTLLRDTVERIPAEAWERIGRLHIVNDGSKDATAEVAEALAQENAKIQVHHHAQNQGYGAVVRQGISLCMEEGATLVACLHGDGQYAPEMLPRMLETMDAHRLDVLQGSRLAQAGALQGGMPLYKWIAGQALCWLENRVLGLRQTDYHSGYLVWSRRFLLTSAYARLQGRFEIDLELIVTARTNGFRIGEVAIPTRYAGEVSSLNPVAYGLRVLWVLWRFMRGKYTQPGAHVAT